MYIVINVPIQNLWKLSGTSSFTWKQLREAGTEESWHRALFKIWSFIQKSKQKLLSPQLFCEAWLFPNDCHETFT